MRQIKIFSVIVKVRSHAQAMSSLHRRYNYSLCARDIVFFFNINKSYSRRFVAPAATFSFILTFMYFFYLIEIPFREGRGEIPKLDFPKMLFLFSLA